MTTILWSALLLATAACLLKASCNGFQVPINTQRPSCTRLWGRVKRGKLAKNVPAGAQISKTSRKKKAPSSGNKGAGAPAGGGISPSLAEWAAESAKQETSSDDTAIVPEDDVEEGVDVEVVDTSSAPAYTRFGSRKTKKKPKSQRRTKQTTRKAEEQERDDLISQNVKKLEALVEEKSGATIDDILNVVRNLVKSQGGNLRLLTAGARRLDYRLAWVGSDEGICHIGTGLHKVPLARLQEVFMSLKGRSRVELLEVIRVLGPFPNVRNTLQGDSSVELGEQATSWRITLESMVDGAGKEILAGTADNIRRVDLQVYFADEKAIVAVVPPETGLRQDIFEKSGTHILVFVHEEEMDEKLDSLRVL